MFLTYKIYWLDARFVLHTILENNVLLRENAFGKACQFDSLLFSQAESLEEEGHSHYSYQVWDQLHRSFSESGWQASYIFYWDSLWAAGGLLHIKIEFPCFICLQTLEIVFFIEIAPNIYNYIRTDYIWTSKWLDVSWGQQLSLWSHFPKCWTKTFSFLVEAKDTATCPRWHYISTNVRTACFIIPDSSRLEAWYSHFCLPIPRCCSLPSLLLLYLLAKGTGHFVCS